MTNKYYYPFPELKNVSLPSGEIVEVSGKITEAVLLFDSRGVKYKLTLEGPKVSSVPPTTIRDLFNALTPESVDFFNVLEQQNDSEVLWFIELQKDGIPLEDHTIHCRKIQGLPPKEDKKG